MAVALLLTDARLADSPPTVYKGGFAVLKYIAAGLRFIYTSTVTSLFKQKYIHIFKWIHFYMMFTYDILSSGNIY